MHDCTCNTDTGWHLCTSQPLVTMHFQQSKTSVSWLVTLNLSGPTSHDTLDSTPLSQFYNRNNGLKCCAESAQNLQKWRVEFAFFGRRILTSLDVCISRARCRLHYMLFFLYHLRLAALVGGVFDLAKPQLHFRIWCCIVVFVAARC